MLWKVTDGKREEMVWAMDTKKARKKLVAYSWAPFYGLNWRTDLKAKVVKQPA